MNEQAALCQTAHSMWNLQLQEEGDQLGTLFIWAHRFIAAKAQTFQDVKV